MTNTNEKPKKGLFANTILMIILILVVSIIGGSVMFYLLSNHNKSDFREYFAYGDSIVTVQDDKYQQVTNTPVFNEAGDLYISFEYVKNNIDEYIYWDEDLGKLTITTSDEVIRFKEDDTTYFVNGEPFALELPVKLYNNEPYLPASLLESLYNHTFTYFPETNIVLVDDRNKPTTTATLKSNTILRYEPNRKGVIEDKLEKGSTVEVFDEYDNFTKIVANDGKVGYIKTNELNDDRYTAVDESRDVEEEPRTLDENFVMVWDNITNIDANSTQSARTTHEGVNVLCPTWFKFDREKLDGTIISYADKDYVDYAHENGYMVWGCVSDVADAYDTVVLENILPNSDYRERAIKQLLSYMTIYDLDGLNIDFEVLRPENSDDYVQFFRELYPYMKKEGKYLSVDTYVPSDWSQYFRRADVAQSVDYFMIMAYDEHNPSTEPGPVASYDFVEQGIVDSLELIPKEKLVLGIPFYTRVWKETVVDGVVQSSYVTDLGMDTAIKRFEKNNATYTYDYDSKYTLAEYTTIEDGNTVTYKAWLETNESIKDKVDLANKYDLQGVSGWRRGLQGEGTFETIDATLER